MPYAFTPDDYSKFQTAVLEAGGDQATLTSILSDFQDTFTSSFAQVNTVNADIARITAENQRLKQTNMELFQRVGTPLRAVEPKEEEEPPESKYKNVDEYMQSLFSSLDKKG